MELATRMICGYCAKEQVSGTLLATSDPFPPPPSLRSTLHPPPRTHGLERLSSAELRPQQTSSEELEPRLLLHHFPNGQ